MYICGTLCLEVMLRPTSDSNFRIQLFQVAVLCIAVRTEMNKYTSIRRIKIVKTCASEFVAKFT